MMAHLLRQTTGCVTRSLGKLPKRSPSWHSQSWPRVSQRAICIPPPQRNGSAKQPRDEDLLKYEREYSSTKTYTSTPMVEEDESSIVGEGLKEESAGLKTFGKISDRFRHKYQPVGTDLIEELEEAELGDDWVKPVAKRDTPIWYGNQMKKLIKEGKLSEAIDLLEVTMLKEARVQPTEFNYNVLIGGCGRAGYTDKAFKLFNRMKERGLEPSAVTYTALFNACAESPWQRTDGLNRLKKLHQQLVEKNIKVNLIAHYAMMKAYAKCGELEMTFKLFRHLMHSGIQLQPKSFSFLLFACVEDKTAGFLYAIEAWRQMLYQGVKPDTVIYNLLLRAVRDCGIGSLEAANRVLLRAPPSVAAQDQVPALPDGRGRGKGRDRRHAKGRLLQREEAVPLSGKKSELVGVALLPVDDDDEYAEATSMDLPSFDKRASASRDADEPVTHWRDTISSARTKNQSAHTDSKDSVDSDSSHWWDTNSHQADAAMTVERTTDRDANAAVSYEVMVKNSGVSPANAMSMQNQVDLPNLLDISPDLSNVQSVTAVNEASDRLALLGGAKGVLDNMDAHAVQPDVRSLSLLAECLPGTKQEENSLMEYVLEKKIRVDVDFYNVIIRRRTWRGDLKAAKEVLSHVTERKLYPNLRTYVSLASACGKKEDGFQLLKDMQEAGVEPTCHLYGALIGATWKHRNYSYLVEVLRHMETKGVAPNERVLTQLEKIATFGQNKPGKMQRPSRPVNTRELNKFRGYYNEWLTRMKADVPQHPWAKFRTKHDGKKIKFHETAI